MTHGAISRQDWVNYMSTVKFITRLIQTWWACRNWDPRNARHDTDYMALTNNMQKHSGRADQWSCNMISSWLYVALLKYISDSFELDLHLFVNDYRKTMVRDSATLFSVFSTILLIRKENSTTLLYSVQSSYRSVIGELLLEFWFTAYMRLYQLTTNLT